MAGIISMVGIISVAVQRLPWHFSIHGRHGSGDSAVNGRTCLPFWVSA